MENKAKITVEKYHMLQKGDTVVIGLSGGADSCALLYFLLSVRDDMELKLIACHVNHLLRGDEAFRDEEFAKGLCEKNNVEFRLLRADVAHEAEIRRESTEKTGRDIRYAFFEDTAAEYNAKIATAHTASDNAETVIFNLARGSGLRGLSGIPPVRGNIIRPLIEVTRNEIEQYCVEKSIGFVTDSTNLTEDFTRNRIRHNVVPALKEINPSLESTIIRMGANLRDINEYISMQAESALQSAKISGGYKADILYNTDKSVFAEILRNLLAEYGIIPEAVHIRLVRDILLTSGSVEIKGNVFAVSKQGILRIIDMSHSAQSGIADEYDVFDEENIVICNKNIKLIKMNIEEYHKYQKTVKNLFNYALDYDTIPLAAVFRTRRSGDVIALPRRNVSKSIKKLFCELKIPCEQRDSIIVLADGKDIMWIDGIAVGEKYAVRKNTRTVAVIDVRMKG